MAAETTKLTDQVFDAWSVDALAEQDEYLREYLQNEALVLACCWSLASQIEGSHPVNPFWFASDFIQHPVASSVWFERAEAEGDYLLWSEVIDYRRHVDLYRDAEPMSPGAYEFFALTDGHPADRATITGREASLLMHLSHAAYNSASGTPYVSLDPFGPPRHENPTGFLRYAGARLRPIAETLLAS